MKRILPTGPSNQEGPRLGNQFSEDSFLQRVLARLVPERAQHDVIVTDLHRFGARVVHDVLQHGKNVEDTRPRLKPYDAWGNRVDEIQVHPSWTALHDIAAAEGLIALPYERHTGAASRLHQMAKLYLFNPSSGMYSCPLAMTDGAAKFLQIHQRRHGAATAPELSSAFSHLTSRIPAEFWTSGQWMTEKNGGSDVAAGCTTVAKKQSDGTYRLYGFKWFTSATDSNMAITLARIVDDRDGTVGVGSTGLSCFFLHVRHPNTNQLNHISIARLKDKLGTKQLPTAELELQGSIATLVSEPGRGVAAISTMVNITRIWNSVSAVAYARRIVALCRDYAHRRTVFGTPLAQNPLHLETLANMEVSLRASLLFVMDAASMLGRSESDAEASRTDEVLLRLLTPVLKLYTAKEANLVVAEGIESFGGAGYVEDTRLPVIWRDSQVLSIWEGTTNVLSHDVLRVLQGTKGAALQTLVQNIQSRLSKKPSASLSPSDLSALQSAVITLKTAADQLSTAGRQIMTELASKTGKAFVEGRARVLAYSIARVYCGLLLFEQASSHSADGHGSDMSALRRYLSGSNGNVSTMPPINPCTQSTAALVAPSLLLQPGEQLMTESASRMEENRLLALDIDERSNTPRGLGNMQSCGTLRARY